MITVYSDGTSISADFATALASDNREFLSRLSVNGTELDGAIVGWTLSKGSCGGTNFDIGAVMSSTFTATLKDLTTNVKNEDIKVEIGLNVNGSYKYITLGYFTATDVKKTHYQTQITAYGHCVSRTGDILSMGTTQTLENVRSAIANATSVTVTLDASIDNTLEITQSLAGLTIYQVLQVLASVVGGYAMDEADGSIAIKKYDATSTLSVGTDRMVSLPDAEEDNFTITGIQVTAGESTYTSGTVNVQMENAFVTQDLFDDEVTDVIGYSYRPATIQLSKGDPRLEGDDVLTVTDIGGSTYIVPCHSVVHTYDGGLSTQVDSIRATMTNNLEGTALPISTQMKEQEKQIIKVDKIASNTNQYFWFSETGTDTGAHITEIPQDDFKARTAIDPTDGGGNLLARSNGIAVRDGLTELATFGQTMQVGRDDEQHITISPTALNVFDEDGSNPFSVTTSGSLKTTSHTVYSSVSSGTTATRTFFLEGVLNPNAVYFGISTTGKPTDFSSYIEPTDQEQTITVNGVVITVVLEQADMVSISFENTNGSRIYYGVKWTDQYRESSVKVNRFLLKADYRFVYFIDSTGTTGNCVVRTYGRIAQLRVELYRSNVTVGNVLYSGTLLDYIPLQTAHLTGKFGSRNIIVGRLDSDGSLYVNNTGVETINPTSSNPVVLTGTYIY